MRIRVEATEYARVETMRQLFRQEAGCQIIHDSALWRGLADPWLLFVDDAPAGYAGIWNRFHVGRVMEFFVIPTRRAETLELFRALVEASDATHLEAQTNLPAMAGLFYDCVPDPRAENILFADAFTTQLPPPDALLRPAAAEDERPDAQWVVETGGRVVAAGGVLSHYNPPYGDIYMEVVDPQRRRGLGAWLVQELKRICWESGRRPGARCAPTNVASRRTLQRAGFLPCGRLLAGPIDRSPGSYLLAMTSRSPR